MSSYEKALLSDYFVIPWKQRIIFSLRIVNIWIFKMIDTERYYLSSYSVWVHYKNEYKIERMQIKFYTTNGFEKSKRKNVTCILFFEYINFLKRMGRMFICLRHWRQSLKIYSTTHVVKWRKWTGVFGFALVNVLEVWSKCCTAFIPTIVLHTAHSLRLLSYSYTRPYYAVSPWSTHGNTVSE